jgi:5-methyltetrahydrofolate--homocysteine methyltransferase
MTGRRSHLLGLVGKYPKIQDDVVGEAARDLFDNAQELLQR